MTAAENPYNREGRPMASPDPVMYRSEGFSGEGYRDPVEVLTFETLELGNSDAVLYALEHFLEPGTALFKEGERLYRLIEQDDAKEAGPEEAAGFFKKCIKAAGRIAGKKVSFGLWLARESVVTDFYCKDEACFSVDAYPAEGGVVLDDLGYDGMFVGFEEEPLPTSTTTYERRGSKAVAL